MKYKLRFMKTNITQENYIAECFAILSADLSDLQKLTALIDFASKFQIATEMEIFNEHKT